MRINLSAVPSVRWFGQALRWPLRWIPQQVAVRITEGPSSSEIRVGAEGAVPVRAFTLDHLVFRDGLPAPTVMKIDVEGAEHAVLRGAIRLLTEKRPLIFLSTHGELVHAECCRLLVGLGYTLRPEVGDDIELCSEVVAQG